MSYCKPLPALGDEITAPYWKAARDEKLSLAECVSCSQLFSYPRKFCPACWSDDIRWRELSGRGRLWTYTEVHVPFYDDSWTDDIPYVVAIVQLDEGPHVATNLVGANLDQLNIGEPVEVVFDNVTNEVTLLKFRLAQ